MKLIPVVLVFFALMGCKVHGVPKPPLIKPVDCSITLWWMWNDAWGHHETSSTWILSRDAEGKWTATKVADNCNNCSPSENTEEHKTSPDDTPR
jgi:hypothetical protein